MLFNDFTSYIIIDLYFVTLWIDLKKMGEKCICIYTKAMVFVEYIINSRFLILDVCNIGEILPQIVTIIF